MATQAVEPAAATATQPEVNEKALLTAASNVNDASSSVAPSVAESKSIQEGTTEPAGPVKKPVAHPAEGCKPEPLPAVTAEQEKKYEELLSTVKAWDAIPKATTKNAEKAPLSEDEKMWLTRDCLLRYLRASKWHIAHATKRVQDTLVWRREYGTWSFTADYISEENATGKQVIYGFDNSARPCLYLLPNKQNTKTSPKQIEHLVFMLERVIDIMPPGQEGLALLVDFRNSSAGSNPGVGVAKQVLNILQNHYPERLGRALITHLPWYVTTFFKLINPFIDPVTKTKLKFNEPLPNHVPPSQLLKQSGGDIDFEYDHSVYWPALDALAAQRRKEQKERWVKAGSHIGESEVYLKGGVEKSLFAKDEEVAVPEETKEVEKVAEGLEKLEVKEEQKQDAVEPPKEETAETKA